MNLKKELDGYLISDERSKDLLLSLFDKDCVVFVAEDVGGKNNLNFIYTNARGKEKNFRKSLTTHFVLKTGKEYVLVTRHNREKQVNLMIFKRPNCLEIFNLDALFNQIIWKNKRLFTKLRDIWLLDKI